MLTDAIEAIGIDEKGSLWVKPATHTFPLIWREAMEVHWDGERRCLYGPKPRKWSYIDWFTQIRDAACEQGVVLELTETTSWSGIDAELQKAIRDRL